MKTPHKQVTIQWGDLRAEVDYEIAPLILALWKLGIHTVNSCQENRPRTAWIEFLTTDDAKQFLDIVAVYPDEEDEKEPFWETLYGRITQCGSANNWEYALSPHNLGVDEEIVDDEVIETCIGPSDFVFSVSIRFPKEDSPLLVERLHREIERLSYRSEFSTGPRVASYCLSARRAMTPPSLAMSPGE